MDHPSKNELRGVSGQKKVWLACSHYFSRGTLVWRTVYCLAPNKSKARGGGGGRIARQFSVHISWIKSIQEMTRGVDEQKRSVVGLLTLFLVWNLGLANWVSFDPQQE